MLVDFLTIQSKLFVLIGVALCPYHGRSHLRRPLDRWRITIELSIRLIGLTGDGSACIPGDRPRIVIADFDIVSPDTVIACTGTNDRFGGLAIGSVLVAEKLLLTVCFDQEHRDRSGSVLVEHDLGSDALGADRHGPARLPHHLVDKGEGRYYQWTTDALIPYG